MTRAVLIPVDGPPQLVDIPGFTDAPDNVDGAVYQRLRVMFPDGFDAIRLGSDVLGYVADCGLIDGSPHNAGAVAVADAVYRAATGRAYHTCIHGPMVVLGVTSWGASTSVPDAFLAAYLPALVTGATS